MTGVLKDAATDHILGANAVTRAATSEAAASMRHVSSARENDERIQYRSL